eukprot:2293877-Pyramimonas_sp.AAC.1
MLLDGAPNSRQLAPSSSRLISMCTSAGCDGGPVSNCRRLCPVRARPAGPNTDAYTCTTYTDSSRHQAVGSALTDAGLMRSSWGSMGHGTNGARPRHDVSGGCVSDFG